MCAYSEVELSRIGGWLVDGLTATQIAAQISAARGETVSRNAIIGIVHRNRDLRAIGFSREPRARQKPAEKPARRLFAAPPKEAAARKLAYLHAGNISAKRASRKLDPAYAPPRRQPVSDGIDPRAYDRDSRRLPLEELGWKDCRWPVNDPERGGIFLFCGAATDGEHSYCAHHARRAVGKGSEAERRAHRALEREAA